MLLSLTITQITSTLPTMPTRPMPKKSTERAMTASMDAGTWAMVVMLSTSDGDAVMTAKVDVPFSSLMVGNVASGLYNHMHDFPIASLTNRPVLLLLLVLRPTSVFDIVLMLPIGVISRRQLTWLSRLRGVSMTVARLAHTLRGVRLQRNLLYHRAQSWSASLGVSPPFGSAKSRSIRVATDRALTSDLTRGTVVTVNHASVKSRLVKQM